MKVSIDCRTINDWHTFHEAFAAAFGFPDFYGNNLNAWIDCLFNIDEPEAGLSKVSIPAGQTLTLHLAHSQQLFENSPEILLGLISACAAVNTRFVETTSATRLVVLPE